MKLPSLKGTPPQPLIVDEHVWLPSIGIPAAAWHPIDPESKAAILRPTRRRAIRRRSLATLAADALSPAPAAP